MNKEIIKGEDCTKLLLEAINELSDTVTLTMGPHGKTVIIADSNGKPYVTKDGVSVANYITFNDPVKNIAANLLREVAQKTVDMAGDGTTTSICLAQAFINRGFELLKEGHSYNKLKTELDILEEEVIKSLKKGIKKLEHNEINIVASISANNDNTIGDIIQQAYNNSNTVKVEESNKEVDELLTLKGMRLNTGLFDKAFINNYSKQSIEYTDIPLLLIDGHLNDLKNVAKYIEMNPQGIAIIADHFSDNVISLLRTNFNKGLLKIALIKSPGFATHRKDLMNDIALFTGTQIIDSTKPFSSSLKLGHLSSLKATGDKVLLLKDDVPTEALELAKKLKKSLIELEPHQKDLTQQRIDNLSGSISVIKVGGKSELEMKERKDRIDDAVLAVSCALEEGIVEGGGCALYKTSIDNLFHKCLGSPLQKILYNGADFNYLEDVSKQNIIDPYKVTRVALQNAISIAKVILSTEAVVINSRLWI